MSFFLCVGAGRYACVFIRMRECVSLWVNAYFCVYVCACVCVFDRSFSLIPEDIQIVVLLPINYPDNIAVDVRAYCNQGILLVIRLE